MDLNDQQRLRWAAKTPSAEAHDLLAKALGQGDLQPDLLGCLLFSAIIEEVVPRVRQLLEGGAPATFLWNKPGRQNLETLASRAVTCSETNAGGILDLLMAYRLPGQGPEETEPLLQALRLKRWSLADRLVPWANLSASPTWALSIGEMPVALLDRLLTEGQGDPWANGHVAALHVGVAQDELKMARLVKHTPLPAILRSLWAMKDDYLESKPALDGWSVLCSAEQLDRMLGELGAEALPRAAHRRRQLARASDLATRPATATPSQRRRS